jgi:hypothetical protein
MPAKKAPVPLTIARQLVTVPEPPMLIAALPALLAAALTIHCEIRQLVAPKSMV